MVIDRSELKKDVTSRTERVWRGMAKGTYFHLPHSAYIKLIHLKVLSMNLQRGDAEWAL